MRNLCVNSGLLLAVALAITVVGSTASFVAGEWRWFSRSGAVVVLIGVLMSARKCVRIGFKGLFQGTPVTGDSRSAPASEEKNTETERGQDIRAAQWGIWVAVVGTLIWGFGDLPDLFGGGASGI